MGAIAFSGLIGVVITMGTNYYLRKHACECCGRREQGYHIGKSSGGWVFALHVDPEQGIHDLDDIKEKFKEPDTEIVDEYDRVITEKEMLEVITQRNWEHKDWETAPFDYDSWEEFHEQNKSLKGPKGLLRRRIDNRSSMRHCIKHGEGTWDCCVGSFC